MKMRNSRSSLVLPCRENQTHAKNQDEFDTWLCYAQAMTVTHNPSDSTKTMIDAELEAAEKRFSTDPGRQEMIVKTRRFKSSWIELAEALTRCRKEHLYRAWAFNTFEEYYKKELHLRTPTVDKLVGSYSFLQTKAPSVLSRDGVYAHIPSYQSIDFLRKAESAFEQGSTSQEVIDEVRQAVLDEATPLPKISRLFRRTLFPEQDDMATQKRRTDAGKLAKQLREILQAMEGELPAPIVTQTQQALERLLQAMEAQTSSRIEAA